MGSFSVWHWLIVIFWVVFVGYPVAKILGKAGFSRAWVFLAFLPLLNLVALWIFAFSKWPNSKDSYGA